MVGSALERGIQRWRPSMTNVAIFRIPIESADTLSIIARPRGGDWLDDEIAAVAREGVTVLVSLLCHEEQLELGLEEEGKAYSKCNIECVSLPVPDLSVPTDPGEFIAVVHRLARLIRQGGSVALHCRQSVGRSGLLAVSVAVALGVPLESALEIVSNARGVRVPETDEQRDWLRRNIDPLSARVD
jgi:protein-tyrosine phosphatase